MPNYYSFFSASIITSGEKMCYSTKCIASFMIGTFDKFRHPISPS